MKDILNNRHYDAKTKAVLYSLVGTLLINGAFGFFKNSDKETISHSVEAVQHLTLDDVKSFIYSSEHLSEDEKKFLYNEDFLNDFLPLVNSNYLSRIRYLGHIINISINKYEMDDHGGNYLGYYTPTNPNHLYVRDYTEDGEHKDTLAHEFVHLCQGDGGYNTITEACAEIISYEYFPETKMSSYDTQVRLVKKLMEIIGPEPVWIYNFTGNFKPIEDEVKPYLSEQEYSSFLECMSFKLEEKEINASKFETLDELIGIIYQNKYNASIEDDEVMSAINNKYIALTRYYFNNKHINREESYYIDRTRKEHLKLSYAEAMERNSFYAYAVRYDPITVEEAQEAIKNGSYIVSRKIDYKSNEIAILRESNRSTEVVISAIIDGVRYDNVSVDDLVEQGIIKVIYSKVYFQSLTAEQYLNQECEEGAAIYTLYAQSEFTLHDDYIEGNFPLKEYLEPISKNHTRKLQK